MADKKIKLALMVGHGTMTNGVWDCGCTYNGYTEAKLAYDIVGVAYSYLKLVPELEIYTDYIYGNDRNMVKSVAWANSKKCDYYISVHVDYSGASGGVYPLYYSSAGKKVGQALVDVIRPAMSMSKNSKCIKRTDLYELTATDMTAVLLETGGIKADLAKLKDYNKYGKALAQGICKALGVLFVEKGTKSNVSTTKITAPKTLTVNGIFDGESIAKAGEWAGVKTLAHKFAGQSDSMKSYIPGLVDYCTWTGKGSATVKAIQKKIGVDADGIIGPATVKALQTYLNKYNFNLKVNGVWGTVTSKAFQRFLNNDIPAKTTATKNATTKAVKTKTVKVTTKQKFLTELQSMGKEMIKLKFKYRNSGGNKSTYAAAKKSSRYSNCADYVSWALQAVGILPKGKKIWLNSKINGSGANALKKSSKVTIRYCNKKPKDLNLKPGDICGFSSGPHTMVYLGKDSLGRRRWASAGGSDYKAKRLWNRLKTSYNSKKVRVVIRIKN